MFRSDSSSFGSPSGCRHDATATNTFRCTTTHRMDHSSHSLPDDGPFRDRSGANIRFFSEMQPPGECFGAGRSLFRRRLAVWSLWREGVSEAAVIWDYPICGCRGAGRCVGHCARRRCCCHHSEIPITPSPIPTPTTDSRRRSRQFMAGGNCGFSCEMSRMTISVMVAIWPLR